MMRLARLTVLTMVMKSCKEETFLIETEDEMKESGSDYDDYDYYQYDYNTGKHSK